MKRIAAGFVTRKLISHKKVLLRERKRHTARRVVSTPPVVLTGYPARPGWGGTQVWYPLHPDLAGGVPYLGTPQQGTPPPAGPGRVPPQQGTPRLDLAGYPPARVSPPRCLPHGILGNVAKHYGIWVPPRYGQTNKVKLLPSRRTTYAGGKKRVSFTCCNIFTIRVLHQFHTATKHKSTTSTT